ncbi:MAG TPA: copper-containing nitrite reductase [Anaerolineales bacterium]|nr:copper-containing nitrite reductase [Anaerolineales bacterium]HNA54220.1 copper-containing nitrite reductase [Anaerolineales bacterium]HND91862.1 copper-containing nitrite reductase [Anaerolineales bacterium]HNE68140.1 copper-containing nitrite reductase [Anaerolineales bacterium]
MKTFLKFLAAAIFLGILVSACTGTSFQPVDKEYVLTTDLREGRLVFLGVSDEINGLENPTLSARPGSTITVTLINGGEGQHNLTFPEVQASTAVLTEKGEEASVTFTVPNTHGEMEYYDDVANHAELGMRGKLMVSETDQPMPVAAEQSNGDPQVLAAFQKGACGSCHAIDGIPNAVGVIAPNLSDINTAAEEHLKSDAYTGTATTTEEYIRESIADPNLFVAPTCPTGACAPNVMPATLKDALTEEEINSIVNYLSGLPEGAYSTSTEAAAPQAPTTGADVVRDPTDLPAPLAVREPQTVRVDLETIEVEGQLADGTTFTYWTFNGAVPGPFIRVRVGDTIEVHLKNSGSSTMNHSVDFHAVTGPGGGAAVTQTEPGKETTFTAKAINPGLYVYHCATPMVANHIANGMYGLILVEPEEGLPPVDREFYVMQGDIYTTGAYGDHGMQTTDVTKLLNEDPEYVVFNGAVGALTDQKPLKANVGETIRIFFGVGGPNLTSSFHVIGEIFDRVFDQASITSAPLTDVQTTLVPPGGATMVEFKLEVPGRFILVDHALSRLQRGLAGFLIVEGDPNPEIFDGTPAPGSGH